MKFRFLSRRIPVPLIADYSSTITEISGQKIYFLHGENVHWVGRGARPGRCRLLCGHNRNSKSEKQRILIL